MSSTSDILKLVEIALTEFDKVSLSTSARRAYRIARLLGDGDESWWFRADLRPTGGSGTLRISEIAELFKDKPYEEVRSQNSALRESWILERTPTVPDQLIEMSDIEKDSVLPGSIDQLEEQLERLEREAEQLGTNERLLLLTRADLNREVLLRISARTYAYLCKVETSLGVSIASNDIFDAHRRRVDQFLKEIAGDVLEKFNAAYRRVKEDDPEARSQALGSCRRILKCVADVVCPVTDLLVVDEEGKSHSLTDDKYGNRLFNFLKEQEIGEKFSDSLHATLDDLFNRIDALNGLSSKGLHAEVTSEEVEWCVIQMYIIAGEILRLHQLPASQPLE